MRTLITVFGIVLLTLIGATAATGSAYVQTVSADNPIVDRGCVIRFDRTLNGYTAPRIHANSTHTCVGIKRVYAEKPSGDLVIEGESAGAIVTINVTMDETFAQRDIQCGPSGGIPVVRVRCYKDGVKVKAYSRAIRHPYANLWFGTRSWTQ
jgi:hypothetical protein